MINLKLALLATTAVGCVTAGGVAYATVGHSKPEKAKAVAGAAEKAARDAAGKLPSSAPTCLPSLPGKKDLPKTKSHHLPKAKQHLPKAGDAPDLPVNPPAAKPSVPQPPANVPSAHVPTTLPKAPVDVPAAKPGLPKPPADLPTCLPSGKPSVDSADPAMPAKPDLPNAPAAELPSCAKVPPAIKLEKSQAKDITLPTGLHFAAAHSHSITIKTRKVCGKVEKFVADGGRFLTVERLQTPPQVTLQELAAALKMQGKPVSVNGIQAWQSPLGTGMVWMSDEGYAISVTGSPAYAAQLPALVTQLRHVQ